MNEIIILRSAEAICAYVNENPKHIARLVRDEALPAWKRQGKGPWLSLPEDLQEWVRQQRRKYLKN